MISKNMKPDSHHLSFSIIGAGNLGGTLGSSLIKKGLILKYVYQKTKNPFLAYAVSSDLNKIICESDIVFIATQESKIQDVAQEIAAQTNPKGIIFFHTSNSLTADELSILKQKGGIIASFSPLQTFSTPPEWEENPDDSLFEGIYFLVEGDRRAVQIAAVITQCLKAHLIPVHKNEKPLFHIAAISACNFLFSILKLSQAQLDKINHLRQKRKKREDEKETISSSPLPALIGIDILLPLIRKTVDNIEKKGLQASLTGPAQRKQTAIIEKHLTILKGEQAELYKALTHFLTHQRGR